MIQELIETKRIVSNFDKRILNSPYKTEYISQKAIYYVLLKHL